jgi:hypothetical protein
MTVVELSTVFDHYYFQDLVNRYIDTLDSNLREKIEKTINNMSNIETIDYSILNGARRLNALNQYNQNR